jgi:hypothetical protein
VRKQKVVVRLTKTERALLHGIIAKGQSPESLIKVAHILLAVDRSDGRDELTDSEIAQKYDVRRTTVTALRRKIVNQGLERTINRKERETPSPALKIDREMEAKLLALSCSEPPEGRAQWSLRLLAKKMVELNFISSISYEAVRKVLKKQIRSSG